MSLLSQTWLLRSLNLTLSHLVLLETLGAGLRNRLLMVVSLETFGAISLNLVSVSGLTSTGSHLWLIHPWRWNEFLDRLSLSGLLLVSLRLLLLSIHIVLRHSSIVIRGALPCLNFRLLCNLTRGPHTQRSLVLILRLLVTFLS